MQPGSFQISLKAILRHNDKFLILRDQGTQRGDLPGGRLGRAEFCEDWLVALRRELVEELGAALQFKLAPEHVSIFPHTLLANGEDVLGVLYEATYQAGPIHLSDEHDAYEWVPLASYDPHPFFSPAYAAAIQRYQHRVMAL